MSTPIITIGSEVTPNRENVVARTQDNDIRHVHEGQRFEITALGCGLAICKQPESGELLSIQVADLKPWLT